MRANLRGVRDVVSRYGCHVNPYKYLFYRVYEWKRRNELDGLALFTALCATAAALMLNLTILVTTAVEIAAARGLATPIRLDNPKLAGAVWGVLSALLL